MPPLIAPGRWSKLLPLAFVFQTQIFSQMIDQRERKNKWHMFGSPTRCCKAGSIGQGAALGRVYCTTAVSPLRWLSVLWPTNHCPIWTRRTAIWMPKIRKQQVDEKRISREKQGSISMLSRAVNLREVRPVHRQDVDVEVQSLRLPETDLVGFQVWNHKIFWSQQITSGKSRQPWS